MPLHDITVDEETIRGIISAWNQERTLISFQRIGRAIMNVVVKASLEGREPVIIKLSDQPPKWGIEKEAWLIQHARKEEVPVPKVLFTDFTKERWPYDVMIMECVQGDILSEVWDDLSDEERSVALIKAGSILARIHSIELPHIGHIKGTHVEDEKNFFQSLMGWVPEDITTAKNMKFIGEETLDRIERLLKLQRPWAERRTKAILNHMDYHFDHLFINEDIEIIAVIDWGFGFAGIPELGFFKPDRWIFDKREDAEKLFMQGYTQIKRVDSGFLKRARTLRVFTDMKFIERLIKTNQKELATTYRDHLERATRKALQDENLQNSAA